MYKIKKTKFLDIISSYDIIERSIYRQVVYTIEKQIKALTV